MVYKCAIWGCPNSSDSVIHYILPADPSRRRLWLEFIERRNCTQNEGETETGSVCDSYRVCADHFSPQSFTLQDLGFTTLTTLNIDAVPTIYPGDQASPQTQAAGGAEAEESCNITISSTVSLASVKEEPMEYDLSPVLNFQDTKSPLKHLKKEEDTSHEFHAESNKPSRVIKTEPVCEEDKRKPFSCTHCEQKFRFKGALVQHEFTHVEDRTQSFRCSHCGRTFAMRAFLKAHEKIHENAESTLTYSCTSCPRRFRYKSLLAVHLRHHSAKVAYKCPVCDEEFRYKTALSQHIKSAHEGSRLACETCGRRFIKIDVFLKHMDKHAVVTPYYCGLCKVYQLTERGYSTHMRTHKQEHDQTDTSDQEEAEQTGTEQQRTDDPEEEPQQDRRSDSEEREQPEEDDLLVIELSPSSIFPEELCDNELIENGAALRDG